MKALLESISCDGIGRKLVNIFICSRRGMGTLPHATPTNIEMMKSIIREIHTTGKADERKYGIIDKFSFLN